MYKFGSSSKSRLKTCHPKLQEIMNELIKVMDVTILVGYRDEKDQNTAYSKGNSTLKYPNSKHNKRPSRAVDVAPWVNGGIPWKNKEKFCEMGGMMKAIAHMKGIKVRWGGDFKTFFDGPHLELLDEEI